MKGTLIVPIRDRRQHKRLLTVRNFGWLALAAAVFLLALTIQSDLRHPSSDGYGRLFGKQVSGHAVTVTRNIDVIREAPVDDQTAADPLLVAPAARSQYLGVEAPLTVPPPQTTSDPSAVSNPVVIRRGVEQSRPLLSGGIFRQ